MTPTVLEPARVIEVPAVRDGEPTPQQPSRYRGHAEAVAFGAAFLVWALYVLPARGGWQPYVVPTAALLLVPSLLVLRPWRHCSTALLTLAAAPALGAVGVALLSPYGDGGPISLSRWGYFTGLLLVTASFARTAQRQAAVAAAVLLVGLQQYAAAWLPWWGGGEGIDGPMLGTIYSANPFGSLMLGFTLAAAGIALLVPSRLRRLGWVVAPACAGAVVLSGARAAILLLACGAVLLAVLAVRKDGVAGLVRAGALAVLCWGVLALSTSSLFFTGETDALGAALSKGETGQTLDSTTNVRLEYWSAAWGEFGDNPLVGGGSGSYAGDSRARMSPAAERSPFAHNEVLGSLAEGGLLLGLPVLVLFVVGAAACARRLWAGALRPASTPGVQQALAVAAGALLAHSLLDFALSIPAILGLVAILLGTCLAADGGPASPRRGPRPAAAALALLGVGLCGGYVGLSHDSAGVSGLVPPTTADAPLPLVRDGRVIVAHARAVAADPEAESSEIGRALEDVTGLAPYDGNVEAVRLRLLSAAGSPQEALAGARELAQQSSARTPLLLLPHAQLLASTGDSGAAFDLVAGQVFARAGETGRVRPQLVDTLVAGGELFGRPEPGWSCAVDALRRAGAVANDSTLVTGGAADARSPRCATWAADARELLGDRT